MAAVGLITQDNTTRAIQYTLSWNIQKLKDGIRTTEERLETRGEFKIIIKLSHLI